MPRRDNQFLADLIAFPFDHASESATATLHVLKVPAGRSLQVDHVEYVNETGLAADPANYFVGTLQDGATVVAMLFNTDSSGGAALTAGAWNAATMSTTPAHTALASGDSLTLVLTKTGTQTLPAGHLVVWGRLQ